MTAIAGPLTLASKGLSTAILGRDQLVASFLGQEGIEFVRHYRDTATLAHATDWLSGLSNCEGSSCMIDSKTDTITACSTTCSPLRFNSASNFYTYDLTDPETPFTRSVRLTRDANGHEAKVSVTVAWRTGIFTRSITLEENLLKWQ